MPPSSDITSLGFGIYTRIGSIPDAIASSMHHVVCISIPYDHVPFQLSGMLFILHYYKYNTVEPYFFVIPMIAKRYTILKASFSVHNLIPKNAQMTTLYTNLSLYITFTMIYYVRQE